MKYVNSQQLNDQIRLKNTKTRSELSSKQNSNTLLRSTINISIYTHHTHKYISHYTVNSQNISQH